MQVSGSQSRTGPGPGQILTGIGNNCLEHFTCRRAGADDAGKETESGAQSYRLVFETRAYAVEQAARATLTPSPKVSRLNSCCSRVLETHCLKQELQPEL
jgi:hypothetical protein